MIKEINFSKKAVEKINQLIAKKPSGTFFRIAVKGGGCSGFKYDFSFDKNVNQEDEKIKNIIIDKASLKILRGSEIDFVTELMELLSKYLILKPNHLVAVEYHFQFDDIIILEC